MTEIFISYKREERHKAQAIAETLAKRGYSLWWDIELLPGDRFADEIAAVIEHAKAAIVLWSEVAVKSDFVRAEASKASGRDILIPVRLDNCELPLPFGTLHTLDLRNWDGSSGNPLLEPLISAVEKKIGHVPTPIQSAETVQEILERPKGEVTFWKSVSERVPQEIEEYEVYISRYGEKAIFLELAIIRIQKLRSTESKEKRSRLENQFGGATTNALLDSTLGSETVTADSKRKSKRIPESSHRIVIVVAIIGLVAYLGASFFGNWDKIFTPSSKPAIKSDLPQIPRAVPQSPPTRNLPKTIQAVEAVEAIEAVPQSPPTPATQILNIDGVWQDSNYPSNHSQITQNGKSFHFTRQGVLPNGTRFNSSGSGRLTGQHYTSQYSATYQSGATSAGDCSGTVSQDGMLINLNCSDSLLGSFPLTAVRK